VQPAALRISQELLLEDTDGNPVLSGTPLAPCLITCAFSAADAEAKPDQPQRQARIALPPLPPCRPAVPIQ
jgi:hypothetical protein